MCKPNFPDEHNNRGGTLHIQNIIQRPASHYVTADKKSKKKVHQPAHFPRRQIRDFDKSRPKRNCPDKERINTLIEYKSTFLGIPVTRSLTLRGVQTPPVWACPTYGFQNNFLGSLSGSFLGSERFGDYPQNKLDEKRATKFVIFGVMV